MAVAYWSGSPAHLEYVRAFCDCGKEFIATGTGITQLDTKWQHLCASGHEEWLERTYPGYAYAQGKA